MVFPNAKQRRQAEAYNEGRTDTALTSPETADPASLHDEPRGSMARHLYIPMLNTAPVLLIGIAVADSSLQTQFRLYPHADQHVPNASVQGPTCIRMRGAEERAARQWASPISTYQCRQVNTEMLVLYIVRIEQSNTCSAFRPWHHYPVVHLCVSAISLSLAIAATLLPSAHPMTPPSKASKSTAAPASYTKASPAKPPLSMPGNQFNTAPTSLAVPTLPLQRAEPYPLTSPPPSRHHA
jgi:hypothetical protein